MAALKLVELVAGVLALIARMRAINLELTKRMAYLTRKRPRSETLERLERQLVLPLMGLTASPAAKKNTDSDSYARSRLPNGHASRCSLKTAISRSRIIVASVSCEGFVSMANWFFTWRDVGGKRTAAILSIIATCIAHYGQLGTSSSAHFSTVPVRVTGLTSGVTAISAGGMSACAIVDGHVDCWGHGGYGELGNDSVAASSTPVPVTGL